MCLHSSLCASYVFYMTLGCGVDSVHTVVFVVFSHDFINCPQFFVTTQTHPRPPTRHTNDARGPSRVRRPQGSNCQCRFCIKILGQDQQALATMHARQLERRRICFFARQLVIPNTLYSMSLETRSWKKPWSAMTSYVCPHVILCGCECFHKCVCFNKMIS